jgi:hypothetical protein
MGTPSGLGAGVHRFQPAPPERGEKGSPPAPAAEDVTSEPDGPHANPPPSILPLDVRPVRVRDLAQLRRLDALYRLNQPDAQLSPYSALRAAVGASLPGGRGRRPAFAACAGERLVGFAHFQQEAPDQRWVALALGASVGVFDADPVWEALMTHAVRAAGLRGVKRLYARLPEAVPAGSVLRRLAWSPYAAETIFAAHDVGWARPVATLRPQDASDTWAIHQLYAAAVPRPVQDAEAFTSQTWDLRPRRGGADGTTVAGWLVQDGHHLVGYARTASRGGVHVLGLVYHPERANVLDDLLRGALAALPDRPARRVYCAVRGYQAEAATALEERGFAPILEQELLVKYTTATVRLPAFETVPFHVDVRDKLPQRVPSFLHGRPRDGSAN